MGGMNHQPCNRFLGRSTQMSRSLSILGISLEQTNVELEDALLLEMKGGKPSLSSMLKLCGDMKKNSSAFSLSINELRKQMDELYYEDLPTIKSPEIDVALANLVKAGLAEEAETSLVLKAMRAGSFYSVLDLFHENTKKISLLIGDLESKTELCSKLFEETGLEKQLEGNLEGNIRVPFAKLYTAWHRLHRLFLASSMVSTDAYYLSINAEILVFEKKAVTQ